jgi:phosphoglycerate-specific signal transduction histidine kinase
MKKELKEIINQSKKSLKYIEDKIEDISEDFTDEVNDFWTDLKKQFSTIEDRLDDAYDDFEDQVKLKSHQGMMEAKERIKKLEDIVYEFATKVSANTQEELDIVKLRAHLLKMEGDDILQEKQKELSSLYENSKEEAEKLTIKAAKEFNQIVLKLTEII